jgi:succinate dehydrogenase/fumarate reductase iron-sulfur protein
MDEQVFTLRVFRFDPQTAAAPRLEDFTVSMPANLTVLQALMKIQDEQDGALAFRFACRGAICGSCGMAVNGRLTLACRTQLSLFPERTIVVEPLPNLTVVKDLLVDMDPFWRSYEAVRPWLHAAERLPEKEQLVAEDARRKIDRFVGCVLCACCYGACPVPGRDPEYLGPAALAKLFRFVADPRDTRGEDALRAVDSEHGVWGCDTVFRCIDHCPKEVRPYDGIGGLRRRLVAGRLLGRWRPAP